uniref:Zeta_toxin domain-containing protein n=1 Tax=Panagrellus redivivus TaxID=6233 RepID=A0A7E4UXE3_PANRE
MKPSIPSSITMASNGTDTCLVGVPSPPPTPTSLPESPMDSPTDSAPYSCASTAADDTASLKSWFETSFSSASRNLQRWTLPILGKSQDPEAEPLYNVFLGGSCGHTVWRSEIVIPYLKKRAITYYDPQRPVWSEHMIYEEALAKESSRLFLFVLDPGTINATSFLEIAYFAARRAPKLVVVFLGRREWSDQAHPMDLPDRIRTCNLLEAILKRHSVPMLTSINDALDYIDDMIIGSKTFTAAMSEPLQRVPYIQLKAKRAVEATKTAARDSFGQRGLEPMTQSVSVACANH